MPSINSKENYYTNYSVQGREHPRSYMHQTTIGSEKYTFIAIDACLEPGPRRPFNFVGVLTTSEADNIGRFVQQARSQDGDYIIWFGHYPTSCILAQTSGGVRSIMGGTIRSILEYSVLLIDSFDPYRQVQRRNGLSLWTLSFTRRFCAEYVYSATSWFPGIGTCRLERRQNVRWSSLMIYFKRLSHAQRQCLTKISWGQIMAPFDYLIASLSSIRLIHLCIWHC